MSGLSVLTAEAKVVWRSRMPGEDRKSSLGGLVETGRETFRFGFVGRERKDLIEDEVLRVVAWLSCRRREKDGDVWAVRFDRILGL